MIFPELTFIGRINLDFSISQINEEILSLSHFTSEKYQANILNHILTVISDKK